jgi:hypothetical protein
MPALLHVPANLPRVPELQSLLENLHRLNVLAT